MIFSISTQLFDTAKPLSLNEIALIKDYDFKYIEIWAMPTQIDISNLKEVKYIADNIAKKNILVSSIHSPLFEITKGKKKWLAISDINELQRLRAVKKLEDTINAAQILGADTIIIHFDTANTPDISTYINLFASTLELSEYLYKKNVNDKNVKIVFENVFAFMSSTIHIKTFLDKYDFQNIGICLDIGHANISEDPVKAIEIASDKLFCIHISDNDGRSDQHLMPFEGKVDWSKVFKTLSKVGYDGICTFEVTGYANYAKILERLRDCVEKFREICRD